jgi:hypothetical protein
MFSALFSVSCYEMLTGKLPSGRSKDNFWGMFLYCMHESRWHVDMPIAFKR